MKSRMQWGLVAGLMTVVSAVVAQAGPPRVSGVPVSRHDVIWHEDGCGCEACAPVGCAPCCRPCLLMPVVAVARGVDNLLHSIFTCHRCYDPACGGCGGAWGGCAGCGGEPIYEEMETVPPVPMSSQARRAYPTWNASPAVVEHGASPSMQRSARQGTSVMRSRGASAPASSRVPARTASATQTRELPAEETPAARPQTVRRTSYSEPASNDIPYNPLRP